jgi:hypothetical protein
MAVNSRIQRRNTLSATSGSQAARATATPRSVTSLTASILNSRANLQTLDSIHRSGGPFDKGTTAEEYRSESRALMRRTLGLQPWKWFANRLSSFRNDWSRVTTAAKG